MPDSLYVLQFVGLLAGMLLIPFLPGNPGGNRWWDSRFARYLVLVVLGVMFFNLRVS